VIWVSMYQKAYGRRERGRDSKRLWRRVWAKMTVEGQEGGEAVGMLVLVQIVANPMVMMLCDVAGAIRRQEVIREHADPAAVVVHCLILSG
jgi:hypothetical protein